MPKVILTCVAAAMVAALSAPAAFAESDSPLCKNYFACLDTCNAAMDECTKGLDREGTDPKLGVCRRERDRCEGKQGCASVFDQSDPNTTGGTLAARAGCF